MKNTTTAAWDSPIGDAPALTSEQEAQNTIPTDAEGKATGPATHGWVYLWNETNQSWDLTDSKA